MEKKVIITIQREFGSRGAEIGKMVGKQLNIPVYDEEILRQGIKYRDQRNINHRDNFKNKVDEYVDLKLRGLRKEEIWFGSSYVYEMYERQSRVIRRLANEGSCILIGRCSDYVLRDRTDCINVYIYSSYSSRYYYILNKLGLIEEETKEIVAVADKARDDYYKSLTGISRDHRSLKHLMIDSELFGVEGSAGLIVNGVKHYLNDNKK